MKIRPVGAEFHVDRRRRTDGQKNGQVRPS